MTELGVIDRSQGRQHVPRQGHHRLDPVDPRHRLAGRREAIFAKQADRQPKLVKHLLHPQLFGLVNDDEQHLVVQVDSGSCADSKRSSFR